MLHYDFGQAVCNPPSVRRIVPEVELPWGYSPEGFTDGKPYRERQDRLPNFPRTSPTIPHGHKMGTEFTRSAPFTPPSETQRSAEQVLETFEGHVDSIEEDSAFVTLKAPSGEILRGRYSATALARYGITEGSRFECSTVKLASKRRAD